jgi:glutamyl-tRNA synthetase
MRVRFAPSPTGFLHIGNARTAVINYLVSRKYGAKMVLRIEDTDMERSTGESELSIMDDLRWMGISWDEGPDKGGEYGPYRQSERFDIYRQYTEKLLAGGKAYHCYCTKEELEETRKGADGSTASFTYNGKCRNLSREETQRFIDEGRKPTVRFHVPENETVTIKDHLKGDTQFNSNNIGGDFIIVRSDGVPVYNYIVVIDDALMNITHVVRGEDHLSNTPKQILIGKALGLPIPEFAHMPLILGPDRSKLSKRHGITSVDLYRKEGYLPEALMNYLAMLGWATESGEEILPFDELLKHFELDGLGKSATVFDFQKLRWMNGQYIRSYAIPALTDLMIPYIEQAGFSPSSVPREKLESIIALLRGSCEVLSDIGRFIPIFLEDATIPDEEADAMLREDYAREIITAAADLIDKEINAENFAAELIHKIKDNSTQKGKKLFMPVRALVTGRLKGPDLEQALPLIGYENIKKRISYCIKTYCS